MSEHDADAVDSVFAKTFIRTDIIEAVLAALKPGYGLGNGLVAVPREPTGAINERVAKMICSGGTEWDNCPTCRDYDGGCGDHWRNWLEEAPAIYRAMIAAAAEPTTRGPADGKK